MLDAMQASSDSAPAFSARRSVSTCVAGEMVAARHIPGDLWPVNKGAVEGIPGVFVKNERSSISVKTPQWYAVAVMVGAYNVGSIRLTANRELGFSRTGEWIPFDGAISVSKAEELGIFELGSTVVLLLDAALGKALGDGAFPPPGTLIRMGEAIFLPA